LGIVDLRDGGRLDEGDAQLAAEKLGEVRGGHPPGRSATEYHHLANEFLHGSTSVYRALANTRERRAHQTQRQGVSM
jgi:hypothetical protein